MILSLGNVLPQRHALTRNGCDLLSRSSCRAVSTAADEGTGVPVRPVSPACPVAASELELRSGLYSISIPCTAPRAANRSGCVRVRRNELYEIHGRRRAAFRERSMHYQRDRRTVQPLSFPGAVRSHPRVTPEMENRNRKESLGGVFSD